MSGYSSFAKNVGVLTIANFGTKILSFLLVPLYTSILSPADYGTYDLVFNTVSVLIPLLTSNVVDAVLRFSIDKDADRAGIIGVGIKHFLISLVAVASVLSINAVAGFSPDLVKLSPYFFLMFATQALSQILLYCARGMNKFVDVAISSVLCSAAIIVSNILFLIGFRMGLTGYFLANIVGPALQIVYFFIRLDFKQVKLRHLDQVLERDMLAYSRPLMANAIAWWVNNVSDRYIVTFFCGVAVNGVYSVATKIPSILSVFQTIIGQAWTISAVDEFDPDDKNGFFGDMYSLYNCVMVIACSLIIALDIPLARLLYANSFFDAWRYVPFLTIAIVFGALAGYIGGILAAVKDSREFARSSVAGAVVNVVLNIAAVPLIGPLGSAVATAVCYWLTWFMRMRVMRKYIRLKLTPIRNGAAYVVLILQAFFLLVFFDRPDFMYVIEAMGVVIEITLFRLEIKRAFSRALRKLKG